MASSDLSPGNDGLVPLRRLGPGRARLLLVAVALLIVAGFAFTLSPRALAPPVAAGTDAALYEALIRDVKAGEPYYAAAPRELRQGGFPLRPFMTVRPPLLTVFMASLPGELARRAALALLAAATWLAWAWRLRGLRQESRLRHAWALTLLTSGAAIALAGGAYLFHEVWAGLAIALSLALRRPGRWGASVAIGLLAALVRELAFPYLATMVLFAWIERERREALAWAGALAAAGVALGFHAVAATAVATAADPASPGWLSLSGWPFILRALQWNALMQFAPDWLTPVCAPLAVVGLLVGVGAPREVDRRLSFLVLGYVAAFCVVGRMNNDYWGLLLAPLWPLGLTRIDEALKALLARARGRPLALAGAG